MEEVVKRHILESFREKYHRAGKRAKGELLKEVEATGKPAEACRKYGVSLRPLRKRIVGSRRSWRTRSWILMR